MQHPYVKSVKGTRFIITAALLQSDRMLKR